MLTLPWLWVGGLPQGGSSRTQRNERGTSNRRHGCPGPKPGSRFGSEQVEMVSPTGGVPPLTQKPGKTGKPGNRKGRRGQPANPAERARHQQPTARGVTPGCHGPKPGSRFGSEPITAAYCSPLLQHTAAHTAAHTTYCSILQPILQHPLLQPITAAPITAAPITAAHSCSILLQHTAAHYCSTFPLLQHPLLQHPLLQPITAAPITAAHSCSILLQHTVHFQILETEMIETDHPNRPSFSLTFRNWIDDPSF